MRNRSTTLSYAASLLALFGALSAAPAAGGEVAKVENAGRALVFHPAIEAEAMTLTVSGPCGYHTVTTAEKGEVAFKLDDETTDGRYKYSLVATPIIDSRLRRALLEARESGDDRAVRELCREGGLPDPAAMTQTGNFMVLEGKILFEEARELQRKSDRDGGE